MLSTFHGCSPVRWVQEVNKEEEEEDKEELEEEEEDKEERGGGKARMVKRKMIKEKGQCLARVMAPGYILQVGGGKRDGQRGKGSVYYWQGESVTL